MAFVEQIETEAGVLGVWKLDEQAAGLIPQFHFSDKELQEFSKIKNEKRKIEYLATRLLLQQLLGQKNEIGYLESGKPFLKNNPKNISISHSANFVVVLLSTQKIGIDVENTQRNIGKIASKFLHTDELKRIRKTGSVNLATTLYWSAKEAIFKCTDSDGIQFDKQIRIQPFDLKKEGVFEGVLNKNIRYKLWYRFYGNNVVVYCVE